MDWIKTYDRFDFVNLEGEITGFGRINPDDRLPLDFRESSFFPGELMSSLLISSSQGGFDIGVL